MMIPLAKKMGKKGKLKIFVQSFDKDSIVSDRGWDNSATRGQTL